MTKARSAPGILRVSAAFPSSLGASRGNRRRLVPLEHDSQVAVIQWWAMACKGYGLPEFALYAVPNAGAGASRGQAGKMKAEGVRPGIPDLCLDVPIKYGSHILIPGLRIEMKREGSGRVSEDQAAVHLYLRQRGYHVVVAYSTDEAIRAIKGYLKD